MAEHEITGKRHDSEEVITHLKYDGAVHPLSEAIRDFDSGYAFFTNVSGVKVPVHKVKHRNNPYLSTNKDGFKPNNLDELPNC